MAGITVFDTLAEAVRSGFRIYDRMPEGYVVRRHTEAGFALALVIERKPSSAEQSELLSNGFERA
jgi:hypothetical protein